MPAIKGRAVGAGQGEMGVGMSVEMAGLSWLNPLEGWQRW